MFALLLLLLSGWRYRGKDHAAISVGIGGLSGFCSGLAQTGGPPIVGYWLGRPIASVIARANILLFFGASDFFSVVSYALTGLITTDAIKFSLVVGPVYAHRRLVRRLVVRPRQRSAVPRDLLRADRDRRDRRPAGAGWRAALTLESSRMRRVGKARVRRGTHATSLRWSIGGHVRYARPSPALRWRARRRRAAAASRRAAGSVSRSAPIRRNAASAARSPLSQAPSIVPHSVSWVASPAKYMQPIGSVRTFRDACPPGPAADIAPSANGAAFQRVALDFFTAAATSLP